MREISEVAGQMLDWYVAILHHEDEAVAVSASA